MAIVNATIDDTTPGTTETTIITASAVTAVTVIYLCNNDTITRTVDIHIKPGAEALAAENRVYNGLSIPAGDTFIIETERLILDNTDVITVVPGEADTTAAITATVSSMEC